MLFDDFEAQIKWQNEVDEWMKLLLKIRQLTLSPALQAFFHLGPWRHPGVVEMLDYSRGCVPYDRLHLYYSQGCVP